MGNGWSYIVGAMNAHIHRTDSTYYNLRRDDLLAHQGTIRREQIRKEFQKKHGMFPDGKDPGSFRRSGKIRDPAYLFHCEATVEAYELWRAGNKDFTWVDLLHPKLAAAIQSSLAHMNGVQIKK
jgi:hypothetical protein